MDNKRRDLSEEELKELQRKEALQDSDEYDIQDKTYDSAPLTRQYVKEDVVVKSNNTYSHKSKILTTTIIFSVLLVLIVGMAVVIYYATK